MYGLFELTVIYCWRIFDHTVTFLFTWNYVWKMGKWNIERKGGGSKWVSQKRQKDRKVFPSGSSIENTEQWKVTGKWYIGSVARLGEVTSQPERGTIPSFVTMLRPDTTSDSEDIYFWNFLLTVFTLRQRVDKVTTIFQKQTAYEAACLL